MGGSARSRGTTTAAALVLAGLAPLAAACGSASPRPAASPAAAAVPSAAGVPAVPCPATWTVSDPGPPNPPPARGGLADTLVPPGPLVATVCRYAGRNQPVAAGTLERTHVVTGPALASLVTALDSPSLQVIPDSAVYSCPMDQGSTDLLAFAYPTGPAVTVSVAILGCRFMTNGARTVGGAELGPRLAAWVGTDRLP